MTAAARRLRELADKATPGPWEFQSQPEGRRADVFSPNDESDEDGWVAWDLIPDNARLIALAPELARLAADMADALERARDTAQLVANGCDTGHLDFTMDDADALLARFAALADTEEQAG